MYCRNCGKEIDDDSRFCIYCGAEVDKEESVKNHGDDEDISEKNKRNFESIKKLAQAGNPEAQCSLGDYYHLGIGCEQSYENAFDWYLKSAEAGNPKAQYNVGECYTEGRGQKKDLKKAFEWLYTSAGNGQIEAIAVLDYTTDRGERPSSKKMLEFLWLRNRAFGLGDVEAACLAGAMLERGEGCEKDLEKAFGMYLLAAEAGYEKAYYKVGYAYDHEEGVEKDPEKVFKWYEKAAEANNSDAQYQLAEKLWDGIGCDVDRDSAVEWYEKAADAGHKDIDYSKIAFAYYSGDNIEKDFEKTKYWLGNCETNPH